MSDMVPRISVRVDQTTIDLVTDVSEKRGEQISDFVRRAIKSELGKLGYLDKNDLKALGVKQ
jgi:uncharacterized protein (DUF1778 family)